MISFHDTKKENKKMKKVFIVSSSPRKGGNSDFLADRFIEGAKSAGNEVLKVRTDETGLKFCTGCMYCQTSGKCVLYDGMNEIYSAVRDSDVLVFVTPVYYYSVSGQLKTFLDRLNPLFSQDNRFKDVYLIATAADTDKRAVDGAVKAVEGWVECFDGVRLKKVLRGTGLEAKGDAKNSAYGDEAFEMGKNI